MLYRVIIQNSREDIQSVEKIILHCSRAFIDPEPESSYNSKMLLHKADLVEPEMLINLEQLKVENLDIYMLIIKANELLENEFKTPRFKRALRTFTDNYEIETDYETLI